MKVIIQGQASFGEGEVRFVDDIGEVDVTIVGPEDEEIERWQILIVHPKVSLALPLEELRRALRAFSKDSK